MEKQYIIWQTATEQEFWIKADSAVEAINTHLLNVERSLLGQAMSQEFKLMYLKQLQVCEASFSSTGRVMDDAVDVLLAHFVKNLKAGVIES